VSEFFLMGGYAAYVWPAYGFAALVLIGLLWQSWSAARRREAELRQLREVARPEAGRSRTPRLARRAAGPVPASPGARPGED
jgi:heme exporter protein D